MKRKLAAVLNPHNRRDYPGFILWFGAYGDTWILVYAKHLETALDECIDWIAENAPGLLATESVHDEFNRLVADGATEEEAFEGSAVDVTIGGNAGDYLNSWEWGIVAEYVTPKQISDFVHGR